MTNPRTAGALFVSPSTNSTIQWPGDGQGSTAATRAASTDSIGGVATATKVLIEGVLIIPLATGTPDLTIYSGNGSTILFFMQTDGDADGPKFVPLGKHGVQVNDAFSIHHTNIAQTNVAVLYRILQRSS